MSVTERITELRTYAVEDGVSCNESSIADFLAFPSEIEGMDGPYLFMLDNGNLQGLWKSQTQKRRIILEFLGEGRVSFRLRFLSIAEKREEPSIDVFRTFTVNLEGLPESLSEENFLAFLSPQLEGVRIS